MNFTKLNQASSYAGVAGILDGAARLFANWKDPVGWGIFLAGVGAILKNEAGAN